MYVSLALFKSTNDLPLCSILLPFKYAVDAPTETDIRESLPPSVALYRPPFEPLDKCSFNSIKYGLNV